MDRDERLFPGFSARGPRYVRPPLENRAISSGSQANPWDREMPMPIRSRPEKPYRLRRAGMELLDETGQKHEIEHLCLEEWNAVSVHEGGVEKPVDSHGMRVI
jgi:hypothetical protein